MTNPLFKANFATKKMIKGLIASIQRMSIHDGPGIRTAIFMKGCNFRCAWCHNPETWSPKKELEWISDKCISCGQCNIKCQQQALYLNEEGKTNFDRSNCDSCFACVPVCFPRAINVIGDEYTPKDLLKIIEQDVPFFEESGGGITFSGGEPMLQEEFIGAALRLLKEKNIHTAIETNLSVKWEKYERVLPFIDLLLADLKSMNEVVHKKWTKVTNQKVLENFKRLDQTGIPFYVRIPVIPGVNDTVGEIDSIALFLSTLKNLKKNELLPYHPLGDYKFKNLGIQNPMKGIDALKMSDLVVYNPILEKHGLVFSYRTKNFNGKLI